MPCSKASGCGREVFHRSKENKETVIIPCQGMIYNVNIQHLNVAFVLESGKSTACPALKAISKMSDDAKDSKQIDSQLL